jgi:hypothetical protein
MVVDVGEPVVLLVLLRPAVVVAVRQLGVVVLMRVPVRAVLPIVEQAFGVVVSDVIVVVVVSFSGVCVLRLLAPAFGALLDHGH